MQVSRVALTRLRVLTFRAVFADGITLVDLGDTTSWNDADAYCAASVCELSSTPRIHSLQSVGTRARRK